MFKMVDGAPIKPFALSKLFLCFLAAAFFFKPKGNYSIIFQISIFCIEEFERLALK